jgi:D-alanine transaminase
MPEVYLNGVFCSAEDAQISVMDRGFLFGDGIYEVIPSYSGRFLELGAHLDRLEDSLSAIRLSNPLSRGQWQAVLKRLIASVPEPTPDRYAYLQVTRGAPAHRDHLCPEGIVPTVLAWARPIEPRSREVTERGIACITRPDIRWNRCEIKSTSMLAAVMMRREAADEGAREVIMLRDGMVTEASAANVFAVAGPDLITPPKSHAILPGITREVVMSLAEDAGVRVAERRIPLEELASADEIWLTSSTREIVPVTRLDGAPVGSGIPGPVWRHVDALYQSYKEEVRAGHV